MPFTSLLLTGLVPNGKIEENHVGVFLANSEADETYLLFSADNSDYFHNTFLKKTQTNVPQPSCCDAVSFSYSCANQRRRPNITICLIELKGGSHDATEKAVDQIQKTYEGIKKGIDEYDIAHLNITWKALIISRSSIRSRDTNPVLSRLKRIFGNDNVVHTHVSRGKVNLTKFMKTNNIEYL